MVQEANGRKPPRLKGRPGENGSRCPMTPSTAPPLRHPLRHRMARWESECKWASFRDLTLSQVSTAPSFCAGPATHGARRASRACSAAFLRQARTPDFFAARAFLRQRRLTKARCVRLDLIHFEIFVLEVACLHSGFGERRATILLNCLRAASESLASSRAMTPGPGREWVPS